MLDSQQQQLAETTQQVVEKRTAALQRYTVSKAKWPTHRHPDSL